MSADQRLRETLDAFTARVREDLDARAQTLAAELTRAVQEADGAVRADSERALAAERQQLEERLTDERAALAGLREDARRDQAAASPLPRVLEAVRRLDAAPSLTGILGVLGHAVHARTARAIVFVLDGEMLKAWADYGFDDGPGVSDVSADAMRLLASALAAQTSATFRAADVETERAVPAFLRPAPDHLGLIAPLSVGGDVVAVVYADGPDSEAAAGDDRASIGAGAAWVDEVELVVRYARARLESVTSERTVSALTRMA